MVTLLEARLWWKLHRRLRVWVWGTVGILLCRPEPQLATIVTIATGIALLSDYLTWRFNY